MRTGQRACSALLIMFTSHSTADYAPGFILLDEPVANMDDLHFLNLIDILRNLAVEGSQIFISLFITGLGKSGIGTYIILNTNKILQEAINGIITRLRRLGFGKYRICCRSNKHIKKAILQGI